MANLMNQTHFAAQIKAKGIAVFSARDVEILFGVSKVAATFLLFRYTKKGIIIRIKRGLYVFPDALPPELYLANKLYSPSYISREFALSYHGVIPETVYEITSVTTKSTRQFETLSKIYSYRTIRKSAFTGYVVERQRGFTFQIADAEKAFVDALYYRILFGQKPIGRFNKEKINKNKALKYAKLFGKPKLIGMLKTTLQ